MPPGSARNPTQLPTVIDPATEIATSRKSPRAWGKLTCRHMNYLYRHSAFSFSFLCVPISFLVNYTTYTMAATVGDLFSLSGRTALVTGGTRGIGQAMAFALAEAGADIILVQVNTSN